MEQKNSSAWLERMFDNRGRVPHFAEHLTRWATLSDEARRTLKHDVDLRYGDGPKETLDVFRPEGAQGPAPVLVFIHGGYWRALDKAEHAFVATPFARAGSCVVLPNYDLCPQVAVPDIALQMVKALAWTWRHIAEFGGDPTRITVVGHSAGGHLAAMMLGCHWSAYDHALPRQLVRNGLAISGMYDLHPVRRTPSLQASLRLTPSQAMRCSPAQWPAPPAGPLYTVVGALESEEYLRQNTLLRAAWGRTSVPVCEELPQLHHFSILESLACSGDRLNALALRLLGQDTCTRPPHH